MGPVLPKFPNNPIIRATSLSFLLTQSSKTQCILCFPSSREMVQGRGSAMTATVLLCLLLLHFELAQAATYTVGGTSGWTFNTAGWTKGKRFKAGDTLVFNYNPSIHNVVAVNRAGYNSCATPKGAKVYRSGKDQIKLAKGQNFFICNYIGHCQAGMKLAVTAA